MERTILWVVIFVVHAYIHKDLFFSYLLGHKATLSTATLSKIYFFNPPKKLFKFSWYNIKYRGKQDTTWNIPRSFTFFLLHFMLQYIAEKRFTSGLGRCTGLANILHLTLFLFVWDVEKFLFILFLLKILAACCIFHACQPGWRQSCYSRINGNLFLNSCPTSCFLLIKCTFSAFIFSIVQLSFFLFSLPFFSNPSLAFLTFGFIYLILEINME